MNLSELIQNIRSYIQSHRNAVIIVSLMLFAVVLWWAAAGFSFEIGRFFAFQEDQLLEDGNGGGGSGGGGGGGGSGGGTTPTPLTSSGPCTPVQGPAWDWTAPVPTGQAPWCTPLPEYPSTFPDCLVISSLPQDQNSDYSNWADLNAIGNPTNLVTKHGSRVSSVSNKGAIAFNNCPWTAHSLFLTKGSVKAGGEPSGADLNKITDPAFTRVEPLDFKSCWNDPTGSNPCKGKYDTRYAINTYTCGRVFAAHNWRHYTGEGNGKDQSGGAGVVAVVFNYGRDCTGSASEKAPGSVGVPGGPGGCPPTPVQSQVQAATLQVQCGATKNLLTWQNPLTLNAAVNTVLRTVNGLQSSFVFSEGGCWNSFGIGTYTDSNLQAGNTYTYRIKTHANVASNAVSCRNGVQVSTPPSPSSIPSSTPIPTSSPVLTSTPIGTSGPGPVITPVFPTSSQLQCAPLAQTVSVGQTAYVQAFGGNGPYVFLIPQDVERQNIGSDRVAVRYAIPGPNTVALSDGQQTVQCEVTVVAGGVSSEGDDADGDGIPDTVECPASLSGQCPDTDGDGIPDYLDTDSDNDGIPDASDPARLTPGSGQVGNPGSVSTGPGEATILALIVSAIISLLYVSYSHSPLYRRREIQKISEDQDSLDFRS
jgi:hypothetical protein